MIVDDGSTDKTIEVVKRFQKGRIIRGEHRGP
ncbi:MAG: glycosyltransferase family 2 protein, partial [Candidatus Pacearchaeota archaeon]